MTEGELHGPHHLLCILVDHGNPQVVVVALLCARSVARRDGDPGSVVLCQQVAYIAVEFRAVAISEVDVGNDQIDRRDFVRDDPACCCKAVGLDDGVAKRHQQSTQREPDRRVVINDQELQVTSP